MRIPHPVIAVMHGVAFGFLLKMMCAVNICWASSNARIGIEEVNFGLLAADKSTLAWVLKPVENVLLLHELVLSARMFSKEEAWCLAVLT